jgi:NAD(P)-dependent dehydrogenase (short-subunit alcohol dehydrogenase family)
VITNGRRIALGLAQAGAATAVLARNQEKNQRILVELKGLCHGTLTTPAGAAIDRTDAGPASILVDGVSRFWGVLEQAPTTGVR